jgi:processing peptidase subunit beta
MLALAMKAITNRALRICLNIWPLKAPSGVMRRPIATEVENVGGFMNAHTSREETAYYLRLLPEHIDLGVDILADILTESTLPELEIERERGVIIQEIGQSLDTPDDLVFDLFSGGLL